MTIRYMRDHRTDEPGRNEDVVPPRRFRNVPWRTDLGIISMIGSVSNMAQVLTDVVKFFGIVTGLHQPLHLRIDPIRTSDIGSVVGRNRSQEILDGDTRLQDGFSTRAGCCVPQTRYQWEDDLVVVYLSCGIRAKFRPNRMRRPRDFSTSGSELVQ